jgi:hypothetical protein
MQSPDERGGRLHTLRSLFLFPARACNNVVFPAPGGPRSSVILEKSQKLINKEYTIIIFREEYFSFTYCFIKLKVLQKIQYLDGFTIPLTWRRILTALFVDGKSLINPKTAYYHHKLKTKKKIQYIHQALQQIAATFLCEALIETSGRFPLQHIDN